MELKRVERDEVIVVIDDEWNRAERESDRRYEKVVAHRGLGCAHKKGVIL
jgi:hypothetical protein